MIDKVAVQWKEKMLYRRIFYTPVLECENEVWDIETVFTGQCFGGKKK